MNNNKQHLIIINDFLNYLNKKSNQFVLKGGTALLVGYGLDRFSEDIDLDCEKKNLETIIKEFCNYKKYNYRITKDTLTTKRFILNYAEDKSLKIEVSYRSKNINMNKTKKIKGILLYDIDSLAAMKTSAYLNRDKIRDVYDLAFICDNYSNDLSETTRILIISALEYKGLDYLEYILDNSDDQLINVENLLKHYDKMYDNLNISKDYDNINDLKQILSKYIIKK